MESDIPVTGATSEESIFSFRPAIYFMAALFFIAATPFEIAQSGFGYIAKAGALGAIVVYALVVRGARTGPLNLITLLVLMSFLLTNLLNWSDRAAIALLTITMSVLLGQARGKQWDKDFQSIVTLFLAVHVGALFVAVLVFYWTGEVLDLHGMIFPNESRAEAYGALGRLSGLHTEPGTYSQWTLMAVYLLALTRRQLLSPFHALVVISVLLTFSLWGAIAVGIFAFAFLLESILARGTSVKFQRLFGVLALSILVIAGAMLASADLRDDAVQYLSLKASFSTQSGMDKLAATEFFEENFSRVLLVGEPLNPGFCPLCISPEDAGLGQTATYYLGFPLFTALLLLSVVRTIKFWNLSFVVPVLLILIWKAHVYEPLLWVIWGYVFRGPLKGGPENPRFT